ncbi:RNA 2',3'-cyclic phosphodiesterase [Paenibacillus sediminis]|uniref:RNA 2',3'-cyclic phosphodiesterase n=1 Tax=Paenibacillus sediminis TaxID=664909 RepID=A0ABS4H4G7_9BACL|nr:RNA 2',3'-cyclic phosphodiesterase [Paenibacillus sediminis]MBP1937361.1 2'-5' RNA ligase [Paenibacillus sediminis]
MSKETSMRLFVAVPIPSAIKEQLQSWCDRHKANLHFRRWVHIDDYHITLQFLGATLPEQMDKLISVLREAGMHQTKFSLTVHGLGTFGSRDAPRVLWAGLQGDLQALNRLQQAIVTATSQVGFVPEDRPYRPHITLASKYDASAEQKFNAELAPVDTIEAAFSVDRFVLYRSHLNAQPMYEELESFQLT